MSGPQFVFAAAQLIGFILALVLLGRVLLEHRDALRAKTMILVWLYRMLLVLLIWAQSKALFWVAIVASALLVPDATAQLWYSWLTTAISSLIVIGAPVLVWLFWRRFTDV